MILSTKARVAERVRELYAPSDYAIGSGVDASTLRVDHQTYLLARAVALLEELVAISEGATL